MSGSARRVAVALAVVLGSALLPLFPAPAQLATGRAPRLRGIWRPVVGAGAIYTVALKGQPPFTMDVGVVGQESVGGQPGYWVESAMQTEAGMAISKVLIVGDPEDGRSLRRMIVKHGDEPAMEMPVSMMAGQGGTAGGREPQRLGRETIVVPAGTFAAEHLRFAEAGGAVDAWVAERISPYGLVKSIFPDGQIILQRIVSGARTRITEAPQPFQIPPMPGGMGIPPGAVPPSPEKEDE